MSHKPNLVSISGLTGHEEDPTYPYISLKFCHQLQIEISLIKKEVPNLRYKDKLKHSLIVIRHSLFSISSISFALSLWRLDDIWKELAKQVNSYLATLKQLDEKEMSELKQKTNILSNKISQITEQIKLYHNNSKISYK